MGDFYKGFINTYAQKLFIKKRESNIYSYKFGVTFCSFLLLNCIIFIM